MNSIIEDLSWRYACKKFDPSKKISDKDFEIILESLRLTPSSYGLQPWKFVVVKNEEKREKLIAASYNQKQVAEASHLVVLCAPTDFNASNVEAYIDNIIKTRGAHAASLEGYKNMMLGHIERLESSNKKMEWMVKQIYIALGNVMTVAATMRIDTCPMEGFSPSQYDEILGLKDKNLTSIVVCPFGYRSSEDQYAQVEKVRFNKDQLVTLI